MGKRTCRRRTTSGGTAVRILLGTLWLSVASLFAAPSAPTNQPVIVAIAGTVQILRAGATRADPAYTNAVLDLGDQVWTGDHSLAHIRLPDHSIYTMGPNSQTSILPPRGQERAGLQLFKGIFSFFHRNKPGDVRVRTRVASLAIRGTEFMVKVFDDGTTQVELFDGELEVSTELEALSLEGRAGVRIEPGKKAVRTPALEANTLLQWSFYYPGVLDLADLKLGETEETELRPSLEAYRSGDLREAMARFPANRIPASAAEKVYLGALLLSVGAVAEAEEQFTSLDRAEDEQRSRRLAGALRRLVAAVKLEESPAAQEPELATEWLAESYYRQALAERERAGKEPLAAALEAARMAVQISPNFGFAWERVAELEFSFGRIEAAQAALDRSLDLAPRNAQAFALKGFLAAARNHVQEAMTAFDHAIGLDSSLGNAWLGRGLVKIRQGDVSGGLADLEIAAALEPQRGLLRSYLGKAFHEIGDNRRALKELELATQLDPQDPTPYLYWALLHQQQNQINQAVRDLEKSQELNENRRLYRSRLLLDQDRAVRSANLANIYADAGMTEVSVREAAHAVAVDYANYSAHQFLANSYNALRDPRQINLRYETAWLNEYLVANLLAPVGGSSLSPYVSQQEYARLFERNRFGFASSTEYLSRGDWLQTAVQHGRFGNSSYALETHYASENGHRPNNDLEQLAVTLRWKQQVTLRDSLFFQGSYYDYESGDVRPYYDETMANRGLRVRESQEPLLLAGYHREWNPQNHTLALIGRLRDTLSVRDAGLTTNALLFGKSATGEVAAVTLMPLGQKYESELEIYTGELQHILKLKQHTLIVGGRYQTGEFDTESQPIVVPFYLGNPPLLIGREYYASNLTQNFQTDFERVAAYAYDHWQLCDPLLLIVGVSYDRVTFPVNHRFAPILPGTHTDDRWSPKAGLVWTPTDATTVRAAYTKSLGGASLDQSFQLEPSQIGGFNQVYRSLIPEAVAGANAGARFDGGGLALEQKLPSQTYVGLTAEWLRSEVNRRVGVYDYVPSVADQFNQSSTQEKLAYRERALTVSLNQLVGKELALGVRYRLTAADLDDHFTSVPNQFQPNRHLEATLHHLNLTAQYNHSSGFFGSCESLWLSQINRGYSPSRPGDDFWQFNLYLGYRFPDRRAELRLGILNLTHQDYHLNPLNWTGDLPRERTWAARFRFVF